MRRSSRVAAILLVLAVSALATTVAASSSNGLGEAKGRKFPPPFLDGNWIRWAGDVALPVDEPCFVVSGWVWQGWKEYSGKERNSLLGDYWFELEINDEAVGLRKWQHHYKTVELPGGTMEDAMIIVFYVQFKADHFEPGTHKFKGIWHGPEIMQIVEIMVTFTA